MFTSVDWSTTGMWILEIRSRFFFRLFTLAICLKVYKSRSRQFNRLHASGDALLGSIERAFLTIDSLPRNCELTTRDFDAALLWFPSERFWLKTELESALESTVHVEVSVAGARGGVDWEGSLLIEYLKGAMTSWTSRIHVLVYENGMRNGSLHIRVYGYTCFTLAYLVKRTLSLKRGKMDRWREYSNKLWNLSLYSDCDRGQIEKTEIYIEMDGAVSTPQWSTYTQNNTTF